MADTAPARCWLLLDTAHLIVGGGDALAVLTAHDDRIGHVHLKHVRQPVLRQDAATTR